MGLCEVASLALGPEKKRRLKCNMLWCDSRQYREGKLDVKCVTNKLVHLVEDESRAMCIFP